MQVNLDAPVNIKVIFPSCEVFHNFENEGKMKIANKTKLLDFVQKHSNAVTAVNKWIETVENNDIKNHTELKTIFPSADYVGNGRYVFNVKGNRYRFVVLVIFINGLMHVRFCGTHAEYDKIKNIENL